MRTRFKRPLKNVSRYKRDPSSRKAIPLQAGLTGRIHRVFRGLKFESEAEIGQKGAFFKGLFRSIVFLSLFLPLYGCTTLPKPGEPYGYLNAEGAIYYIYIDGNRHYTGFGDGTHTIDIKVKAGIHCLGYENKRLGKWTDLCVPMDMKKDQILILEVEPGMRYYIGPAKREVKEGYIFRPVVKKKEKVSGY